MSARTVLASKEATSAIPLHALSIKTFDDWLKQQPERVRVWVKASRFSAKRSDSCLIPSEDGQIALAIIGIDEKPDLWDFAAAAKTLPAHTYRLESQLSAQQSQQLALGWGLTGYRFDLFREKKKSLPKLVLPDGVEETQLRSVLEATFLVRDLITTPASDMGPAELEQACKSVAQAHSASFRTIVGTDLLKENFPSIHAVGRAASSDRAPRLIDIRWGNEGDPRVSLVGKGVCFDTGGLDLKPARAMKLMKKDMGGAAQVLGVAKMVMDAELPVRLRVLIPAVENSVSASALRPLDVVRSRNGKTIEIGNTDAEGRVILADALAEASEEKPERIIDFATLTGAARIALGTELPALFCNDETLSSELLNEAEAMHDPLWRMPLWQPYRSLIDGKSADITNSADSPYGGAITAALFLSEFVESSIPWAHIDLMAWNSRTRPGRPEGGEAMGMRAVFAALERRYS